MKPHASNAFSHSSELGHEDLQAARSRRRPAGSRDRQVARQGRRRGEGRPAHGVGGDRQGGRGHSRALRREDREALRQRRATSRTSARRSSRSRARATRRDTGTVVGKVEVGQKVVADAPAAPAPLTGGIKATPAVRALARKLNVDLTMVTPTGADGLITASDVQRAARILAEIGPIELHARRAPGDGAEHGARHRRGRLRHHHGRRRHRRLAAGHGTPCCG